MKLKTFLTILFSLSLLSLLSTETPFDWPHNLEKSDEVAQVKITDVQGEKVTATVVQSFTPEIGNGKKITFINNDPSANFSVDNDYFVFLENGKKKNHYILPAAANLPVSDTVVMFNFSSGEAPYKHAVSDLSEFLNVYYHTELRPDYCDKLFRMIEHSSAKQWIDDRAKEAISQYLILNPEGSEKIKDFLRENFLQFINSLQDMNDESHGEGVLFRGIQYMNIMKDLGIWNLESYFYDFMREFNGLSFQFRENPELFQLKKAKEDSLLTLINETKPDFLPAGQWTVWVRLDDDFSMKYCMAEFYYGEVGEISEHLIFMLVDYMKEHFGCDIGVYHPKDYPLFTSGSCTGNQLLGHFINYLVPHAGPQDITFLLNLQRYGYVRTVEDAACFEKLIQAAEEVESKTVTKSRR